MMVPGKSRQARPPHVARQESHRGYFALGGRRKERSVSADKYQTDPGDADPAAAAAELTDAVAAATQRLHDTATALSDEQVRAPSVLPGWSRGHVLTHI